MSTSKESDACPCQSGKVYGDCCQPLHEGVVADSAESLMRSRYSAYVMCKERYLLDTWHPTTRPPEVSFDPHYRWLGLKIREAIQREDEAWVEFVARYRPGGNPAVRMTERSRFMFVNERWLYVDGIVSP